MSQLQVGIVGLPNVGKSTLFNALLRRSIATSANYPFTTIEPNIGVVEVPDDRLDKLAFVVKTDKIIHATVEFVDIAGLVKGAASGEGLGNKFLSHIREVDAILHLVRDFTDSDVVRTGTTPMDDIETVNTELALADLETVDKLMATAERQLKTEPDKNTHDYLNGLKKLQAGLSAGKLASAVELTDHENQILNKLPLLTIKPQLLVRNVSEGQLKSGQEGLVICAKLEAELADLSEEESKEYLTELGIKDSGLEKIIRQAYSNLNLISFLTAGEKEVRAWTITAGIVAPQAAGVIHTDFEKGFIKADVVNWHDLVAAGGWAEAKAKGLVRLEGRDYIVKDGDVIIFRTQT
jgi:GTP-binding protein YchF